MELIGFQGDCVFFKVDKMPQGLSQDEQTKNAILAYGEASGHAHQFEDVSAVEVYKESGSNVIYINVKRETRVTHGRARDFVGKEVDHDYHSAIVLHPGLYASGIVEETDWITGHIRKVVD